MKRPEIEDKKYFSNHDASTLLLQCGLFAVLFLVFFIGLRIPCITVKFMMFLSVSLSGSDLKQ